MFQCIIQQRNGWIHAPSPEMRDVFPGKENHIFISFLFGLQLKLALNLNKHIFVLLKILFYVNNEYTEYLLSVT